jgi:heat shock protein HtpX
VNLFEQQASNRRKSRLLIAGFLLFFAWLGLGGDWLLYQFTLPENTGNPDGYRHVIPWFGIAMSVIALIMVWSTRRKGADRVLSSAGAWELLTPTGEQQQLLTNVVEEMSIASGVPVPRIYIIDDPDPNAFVTGADPAKSHLAVTQGLLDLLDRDELQAVVAHELGHVKNLDMQLMTLVAGLAGVIALISDGTGRMIFRSGRSGVRLGGGGGGGRGGDKNGGGLIVIVLVLWLISWALAPLVTRLLALGISRKREYLADAMAAQFTRNPAALASALDKIEKQPLPTKAIKKGVAHLCIADPLGWKATNNPGVMGELFSTHPPMAIRVARLKAMAFQDAKKSA